MPSEHASEPTILASHQDGNHDHHHGGSHGHPGPGHDYVASNKSLFDELAEKFDDIPHAQERARRSALAFRNAYPFKEDSTTVMDFACGTGLVSRELAPYCKSIIGVDISQGVVDQFNKRVGNQGIPHEEMQAFCTELKGAPGELDDRKFDVIICASSYHHFASIDDTTQILAYFLKPGGALLVIDLLHGHMHRVSNIIGDKYEQVVPHRHGVKEEDIRGAFERAGLQSFSFEIVAKGKHDGEDAELFLVKGNKPEA